MCIVWLSRLRSMHAALCNTAFCILPHEVIDIDEGDLLHITADGIISRNAFNPHCCLPHCKWSFRDLYSLGDEPEEDDSFAMLMDMAGYFGITEDEIRYMRDMGYSYDEDYVK